MSTVIKAQPGESTEGVIRRFKKQVLQDDILTEVKKRERYKKPSELKKERLSKFRKKKRRTQTKKG
ncbi:30S ribosomal protein S21 [Patescibacteria group bacterium]|nr:30S ribosomal protein S21 [Patescibacteria group bacterium]MBU1931613.1 30S ribosomal protein S21 [Patescibacteria group bacterium]